MIITISGKPCTGKSTMAKIFASKYGFERIYAGGIFKSIANERGIDILELVKSKDIVQIDREVDERLGRVYIERFDENILIESRTAWSFMPNAFDVSSDVMAERLFRSDRSSCERGENIEEARKKVEGRYVEDIERYKRIYGIDCADLSNYDLIVDNSNLTPEETADFIFDAYQKYLNK